MAIWQVNRARSIVPPVRDLKSTTACQGQDKRAPTLQPFLLRGLDTLWSVRRCPHREGTPVAGAADGGHNGHRGMYTFGKKDVGDRLWRLRWSMIVCRRRRQGWQVFSTIIFMKQANVVLVCNSQVAYFSPIKHNWRVPGFCDSCRYRQRQNDLFKHAPSLHARR